MDVRDDEEVTVGGSAAGGAGVIVRVIVAALGVAVLTTACAGGGGTPTDPTESSETSPQDNVAIAERITTALAADVSGVDELEVTYVDNVSSRARVAISLRCDSCDGEAIVDRAVGQVWTSRIAPLESITVYGQVIDARTRIDQTYVLPDDEDELVGRYGPRPVTS